ncbi:MAG: AAA family ATPase [Bacteroidota bacterium]
MQIIQYPILYFQLNPNIVLGMLVGTSHQLVQTDLKSIQQRFKKYIERLYKKDGKYYDMDIVNPKLSIVQVQIRPTYRSKKQYYPSAHQLHVPVAAVHGQDRNKTYSCYLPLFDISFQYYDDSQFRPLVTHFTHNHLNNLSPASIYKYLRYPVPQLTVIKWRVDAGEEVEWKGWNSVQGIKQLKRLTAQYPPAITRRQASAYFPEAAWELEHKVAEVMDKIVQARTSVLLVGAHGVGKSAVLRQAIRKIKQQQKNEKHQLTFWRVMAQRLTATAKYFGEWQGHIEKLVEELQTVKGVLWVEQIMRLLQMGGIGAEDSVAAFLVGFLQQGKLQMIGEVTDRELDSLRRLLPGFAEHFQVVNIKELSEAKTRTVLAQFADVVASSKLQIQLTEDSLQSAYQLLKRFEPYEQFPGKGLKFLGQVVSHAHQQSIKQVEVTHIIDQFATQTGLPQVLLDDDMPLDVAELYAYFEQKIIGQPMVVEQLVNLVKLVKAGLNNPQKPIATLIFAGPTGVGKTASVRALADYFFGKGQQQQPLIRIDMSEYQYPGQLHRFIGSGKELGELVKKVREQPFSVVLLDEIEKAHASIFDALLTVLDEGLMVDTFGRVTNFRNTIIIMTSNLGATVRAAPHFQASTDTAARYRAAIERHFRPEYINRIDHVVYFNALAATDIQRIARKELQDFNQRAGLRQRNLSFVYTDRLVAHLATQGYDKRYGARMLQRVIDEQLTRFLAMYLLQHPSLSGVELRLDYAEGQVEVAKSQ